MGSVESPQPRHATCSILLIEDDLELCALIKDTLRSADGFHIDVVHDGRNGLSHALCGEFNLVILDIMLPFLDGFEVLRQIRKRISTPVIVVTARGERTDRVTGLNLGADDYLPKPFWPEELIARVRAVLRRSRQAVDAKPDTVQIGQLTVVPDARIVRMRDQEVSLTTTEFDILDVLVRSSGRTVSRDELAAVLYQRRATPYERSLDVHISHLRRKVSGGGIVIQTIRNVGYTLALDPSTTL